jgi:hypothetical protein
MHAKLSDHVMTFEELAAIIEAAAPEKKKSA